MSHEEHVTAGEGLVRHHATHWRQKAAGFEWELDADDHSRSDSALLMSHATAEGKKQLRRRKEWEETRRKAQGCCCWDYLVVYPMRLFVACGVGIYRRWMLPPLAWLCTLLLRVLSMIMDAFSMLFMALEEDLRYAEQNRNHADRHISHALAQLHERHFHGKSVAITAPEQVWIVLFYSPRSKLGGSQKLAALKEGLKDLSLPELIHRAELAQVDQGQLTEAQEFRDTRSFICPWAVNDEAEEQVEARLKTNVISFIVRATYRRSGIEAVQRFNDAARHLEKAFSKNPENAQTRADWPACPAYQGRTVKFGVVNIDDMMSNNDELALNMGVSSLDPRFMLLDGDNVPMKIEEEHMEVLLAYGSEFWKLDDDGQPLNDGGASCMRSLERMLRLVAEDRRERKSVQTDTVHALIKKTATIDGALQSFISKYGDRRRLLRCAQHILHGSSISTTGAIQTVLISAVLGKC